MKKRLLSVLVLLTCILVISSACVPNKNYYFTYDGIWGSEAPFLWINCKNYEGYLTLNGSEYFLETSHANNGVYINIYNKSLIPENTQGLNENYLIWKADTKVKNNKLYLTVTEDKISDYEGKTIVLDFYTYEEWEEKQNAG